MSYEHVNHPAHYNQPNKKECIVEMEEKHGTLAVIIFCILTAEKYDYRAGTKPDNSADRDHGKALWYRRKAKEKTNEYLSNCGKIAYYIREYVLNHLNVKSI